MSGYCKLFSDIVESSIWDEPPPTCKVWVTLLALCDSDGYVRGSPGWLAGKARVTVEQCNVALALFADPDPRSRTPDHEGRRIEMLADGWLVLNYLAFRERLSDSPRAISTRERVKRHRQKHNERYVTLCNAASVTLGASASASAVSVTSEDIPEVAQGGVGGCGRSTPVERVLSKNPKPYSADFESAWTAFGKYGAKPKAAAYWRKLTAEDRTAITAAIPAYLACVEAGRAKKQFEGWINPENRLWEMDWAAALEELTRPIRQRPVEHRNWNDLGTGGL